MPAVPINTGAFSTFFDKRYSMYADGLFDKGEDFVPRLYTTKTPTQLTERVSGSTPIGLHSEFGGIITYDGPDEGYNSSALMREWALAMQTERLASMFDLGGITKSNMEHLSKSAFDTRQTHATRVFPQLFSNDTAFYTRSQALSIANDSQTCPRETTSTASGFDNAGVGAFSPATLRTAYIQFRKLRDDAGRLIRGNVPTHVFHPIDLQQRVFEVLRTVRGLDGPNRNENFWFERVKPFEVDLWDSTASWGLMNLPEFKKNAFWYEKIKREFTSETSFESMISKTRSYMAYTILLTPDIWRTVVGFNNG